MLLFDVFGRALIISEAGSQIDKKNCFGALNFTKAGGALGRTLNDIAPRQTSSTQIKTQCTNTYLQASSTITALSLFIAYYTVRLNCCLASVRSHTRSRLGAIYSLRVWLVFLEIRNKIGELEEVRMNTGRTGTLSFYVEDVADVKSIMEAGLELLIETSVNFTGVREFQSQLIRVIKMYCVTVLWSQIHDTA